MSSTPGAASSNQHADGQPTLAEKRCDAPIASYNAKTSVQLDTDETSRIVLSSDGVDSHIAGSTTSSSGGASSRTATDEALLNTSSTTLSGAPTAPTSPSDVRIQSSLSIKPGSKAAEQQLMGFMRGLKKSTHMVSEQTHKFWSTQPVPTYKAVYTSDVNGPIEPAKTIADVRQTPYSLPAPYGWSECDLKDDGVLAEVYDLLNQNYVEDDDNMFRFDYSKPFLRWALCLPHYKPQWHLGVRSDKGKLVAFITGVPANLSVYDTAVKVVEINFLCVHKKLRSRRLAPMLIKEITRRVNLEGIWQAVYTAGITLPTPVTECTYFHRALNIKKLVEIRFSALNSRMTMKRAIRLYSLPDGPKVKGLRPMLPSDVQSAMELVQDQLKENCDLYPVFEEGEFAHMMLPRENVVVSYVKESEGKVTDFLSFYILPSSVIENELHQKLNACYCFYNVATTVSLTELIQDALIIARDLGMDVFNCLNLNKNGSVLSDLKFGIGDGSLRYYLFNWKCPRMEPSRLGLTML